MFRCKNGFGCPPLLTIMGIVGFTMTGAIASPNTTPLTDINDHWGELCIQQLQHRDIIQGYPDNTFRPNEPVTRAEFAAMLSRAFPDHSTVNPPKDYEDINETYWGLIPIDQATQLGFMEGYPDGSFAPSANIPRYEVLLALVSGLGYRPQGNPQTLLPQYYEDADQIPPFAYGAIAAATEQQLIVNYPNITKLNPRQWASRADVASFLCRALKTSGTIPNQYIVGNNPPPSQSPRPAAIPTLQP